jgi:hypothetical protein
MNEPKLRSFLFLVLLVLAPSLASAQDIRLPPPLADDTRPGYEVTKWLTLRPVLRQTVYFTSNVFQERPRDAEDDTVFATIFGADLLLARDDRGQLELGYYATGLAFAKNGGSDTVEQRVRLAANGEYDKFSFDVSGRGAWASFNTDPQFAGRIKNFNGGLTGNVEYAFTSVVGGQLTGFLEEARNFPRSLEPTNSAGWGTSAFVTLNPNLDLVDSLQFRVGAGVRDIIYTDKDAFNPTLELLQALAGATLEYKNMTANLLVGVEFVEIKHRRRFPRSSDIDPSPLVSGSVSWENDSGTRFEATGGYRMQASGQAAYQHATTLSATISQELPGGFHVAEQVAYVYQNPHRNADLRQQTYQLRVGWSGVDYVDITGQIGYTRSSSRRGGFEVFTGGIALTLKI